MIRPSATLQASSGTTLRLVTYNVHGCRGVDGKVDVGRVADVIAGCRPDVVALQELDVGRRRSGGVDQAHVLASRLGMGFHFNAALNVAEERYGDALLTALPMRLVKTGPLPTLAGLKGLERRGAVWVEVTPGGGRPVQIINTHLGLVPQEQMAQVRCLLGEDWLSHSACLGPVVLLGDFNATPRYAAYRALTRRLTDARRLAGVRRGALTFPSRLPLIRIDHIFVSRELEARGVLAVAGGLSRIASDHLPLLADLAIRSPGAP